MIKLGTKVKDVVTGYTGIAWERSEFLVGGVFIGVAANVDSDNRLPGIVYFAEERLMATSLQELQEIRYPPVGEVEEK